MAGSTSSPNAVALHSNMHPRIATHVLDVWVAPGPGSSNVKGPSHSAHASTARLSPVVLLCHQYLPSTELRVRMGIEIAIAVEIGLVWVVFAVLYPSL